MKNEQLKLVRDLFHLMSLGSLGLAFFSQNTPFEARLVGVIAGAYFHLIVHVAVAYDRRQAARCDGCDSKS